MKTAFLLITTSIFLSNLTHAQPGRPDPSFGNHGVVTTDLGSNYSYTTSGRKVLTQNDGSSYLILQTDKQAFITKRHSNGSVDSSYGHNGFSDNVQMEYLSAAVLQPDGKILIGGANSGTSAYYSVLARFTADGSPDSSFSDDGVINALSSSSYSPDIIVTLSKEKIVVGFNETITRLNSDGNPDSTFNGIGRQSVDEIEITGLAVQKDGKIVIGSNSYDYFKNTAFYLIARYNTDGSPDTTFGNGGQQKSALDSLSDFESSIVIQNDDKILVGGTALIRFSSNGSLDNSFSNDGIVKTDFIAGTNNVGISEGYSLALQTDGKIVVAGNTQNNGKTSFTIARYNNNGSIDKTFSGDGMVTNTFEIASAAIQKDGKIIAGGSVDVDFALARYNANGTPDNTFDHDGKLTGNIRSGYTIFTNTAIQTDGKIVAAGRTWNGSNFDFAVARYNTDGSLDHSFSGDGSQTTDFTSEDDYANGVTIQKDGKIVVVGYSIKSAARIMSVSRYNTDGTLDNTFSSDGKLQTAFEGTSAAANSVAIQSDGKIVAAGNAGDSFAIVRYNTNGSLDKTFDKDGKQTIIIYDYGFASSVAIQSNGKIIVGGLANHYRVLARLNANGSRDYTFGYKLINEEDVTYGDDVSLSVVIQNDGKIVAGGYSFYRSENENFVNRFTAEGNADSTFQSQFTELASASYYPFNYGAYGNSVAIQSDGKIVVSSVAAFTRYNTNGTLDTTFGTNGIQATPESERKEFINSIAIFGNKLYGAGSANAPGNVGVVVRYLLDNNNTFPTVKITTPANNATYTAPATITIKAAASDADGTISFVKFYNGGTLLSTDSTSPYSYTLTNVSPGNYSFVAKATDNNGRRSISATVAVTVLAPVNKAPAVKITSPANNAVYNAPATITINATATDSDGTVSFVRFYNGGTLLKTDSTSPYTCTVSNLSKGNYSFVAKATDHKGLTGLSPSVAVAVSVSANKAPVVSITNPARNAVYTAPANITINASASDADGTIASVKFYNGGTLLKTDSASLYTYTLTNAAAGTYSFTAKATDNKGLFNSSGNVVVTVVAAPNNAPVVSITSPANNTTYNSPATLTIHAAATDADGKISNVKFYNGSTLLATDSTSPYSYTFNNPAPGSYSLTAKATDNLGLFSSSASTSITVSASANKAPVVSIASTGNNVVSAAINVKVLNSSIISSKPYSKTEKTALNDALRLRLSPNPASSIVNIQTNIVQQSKPATLSIISLSGMVLKTMRISSAVTQLNVSTLASGVYTIKIISGDKVTSGRFVKL